MSLFQTVDVTCPVCGAPSRFEMVHSVFADRRLDLRDAILDRGFQRQPCPACGEAFRVEPQFTYVHLAGGRWVAAWPASGLAHWGEFERRGRDSFDASYGAAAPAAAAAIGRDLAARVTFGWEALREKLVAAAAGIDDVTLELAKIALLRTVPGLPVAEDTELRLVGVEDGRTLRIGHFPLGSEEPIEVLSVPAALIAEIEADPEGWRALRESLAAGPFVDVARLTIEPTPA